MVALLSHGFIVKYFALFSVSLTDQVTSRVLVKAETAISKVELFVI